MTITTAHQKAKWIQGLSTNHAIQGPTLVKALNFVQLPPPKKNKTFKGCQGMIRISSILVSSTNFETAAKLSRFTLTQTELMTDLHKTMNKQRNTVLTTALYYYPIS